MKLNPQKLEGWSYRMVKLHNPIFNLSTDPPCYGHTDRQTDGRAIAHSALSIMLYAVAR